MSSPRTVLVATARDVLRVDARSGDSAVGDGLDGLPTCLAADRHVQGRAWCGTARHGVFRTEDGGRSWVPVGLSGEKIMSVAASLARQGLVWVGTEPSRVFRSDDGGDSWRPTADMETLPSVGEWSFPPRPDTHHVRWIASHPSDADHLWVAVEAGALVGTRDGGASWHDRVAGGPYDTHELAVHPDAPELLRVAAGDGYFESADGGRTWASPSRRLDVGYLRSVAVDPGDPSVVLVSASSWARSAYMAGHGDGRVYRRVGDRTWERVAGPWADPARSIAPLLAAGTAPGELWAADERGLHRTDDGGLTWHTVASFDPPPSNLRGVAVLVG